MNDKNARPAGETVPAGERLPDGMPFPAAPGRKLWHAPQFMLTDIALTNAGSNPPTLDAPTVSQQS